MSTDKYVLCGGNASKLSTVSWSYNNMSQQYKIIIKPAHSHIYYAYKISQESLEASEYTVNDLVNLAITNIDNFTKAIQSLGYHAQNTATAIKDFQDAYQQITMPLLGSDNSFMNLSKSLPAMNEVVICPQDGCVSNSTLWNTVQHLNDHHRWTREAIADWIDLQPFDTSFKNINPDRA